jgi:hypothetical protein
LLLSPGYEIPLTPISRMKKNILLIVAIITSIASVAQDVAKQKEVGLLFYNFDNFGITYKTGSSNVMWRLNSLYLNGNNSKTEAEDLIQKQINQGFSLSAGREYRSLLSEKLELRYGFDLSFGYSRYEYKIEYKLITGYDKLSERITYGPGINGVFGFNYILKEKFVIGAEILPSVNYTKGKETDRTGDDDEIKKDVSSTSFGLGSRGASISLSYRF